MRFPKERPNLKGLRCLKDLPPAELTKLLGSHQGFGGGITLEDGNRCTWNHEINLHGPQENPDTGRLDFMKDGSLMESGDDFMEEWIKQEATNLVGRRIKVGNQHGILITNGTQFMIGFGPALNGSNTKQIAAWLSPEEFFKSNYSVGYWIGNNGYASLSTNPFDEKTVVITRGPTMSWTGQDFEGNRFNELITVSKSSTVKVEFPPATTQHLNLPPFTRSTLPVAA